MRDVETWCEQIVPGFELFFFKNKNLTTKASKFCWDCGGMQNVNGGGCK